MFTTFSFENPDKQNITLTLTITTPITSVIAEFDSAHTQTQLPCSFTQNQEGKFEIVVPTTSVTASVLCNIGRIIIQSESSELITVFKAKYTDLVNTVFYLLQ
ncbi:Hypothetical_protein [Hexamita inflata]|uniref:Hypothetical_protein n=1 Tax=Hexamita inflata TaxID=28002 RepID=A0AA86PP88_9EUKA|nr:Hypothetical protein HINF_LOCUS29846 [Hexamita inflata]